MTTITIDSDDKKIIKAVRALLKDHNASFKVKTESPYNPEFVKKIEQSRREIAEGKFEKITLDDLWK